MFIHFCALLVTPGPQFVTGSTVVLIARRTDDRSRDIDEANRAQVISRFTALGIETIQFVSKYVPPERADAVHSFEVAAARLASCHLFQLPAVISRVANLRSESFEIGINLGVPFVRVLGFREVSAVTKFSPRTGENRRIQILKKEYLFDSSRGSAAILGG